ncbi:N-acetyltransferase [Methanolobus mangrovi]|uniref:N-acetyltransferase n=1 Tax=Methanolobus mangrovi TaxID=3072977 RepID=A0AA51YIT5_9EURY|nr:N-acetyltransferase [Methanolobus mangrovi]WMW21424.1 N-acetyltransferase [Methanolobus mangrovi]
MIIRKATVNDIPGIKSIIDLYAKQEKMLPRSLSELYEFTRSFYVCEMDNDIVGCCALQVSWEDMAEVMSFAVKPEYREQGIGTELINACLKEAKELGINNVFTLTYAVPFFEKQGFEKIDKQELPHKVWSGCIKCPKFPNCDEVAMLRTI